MAQMTNVFTEESGMPFSLEAEQAVLGAVLLEPSIITRVADKLQPEHFYLPEHQSIFREMLAKMMEPGAVIDFVTILESLKNEVYFQGDEGKKYLFKLAQMVPSYSGIEHYAAIVREKYDVRLLIRAARKIQADAMEPGVDFGVLVDSAEQQIYDIRNDRQSDGLRHISQALASSYEIFTKMNSDERDQYVGIPSGISALDAVTTGLNRSDLIIVGARPGMGKTSFALNIARNVAVQQNKAVAFFNLEMSREQMVNRLLSSEAKIESKKLRTGNLTPDEWTRMAAASDILCKVPIYLDDTASITVPQMKARILRQKNIDLVVVDYLQLMHSSTRTENRVQEVSEITRSLKIMAKELNIPVMVCAQLARGTEKQANHRPALADLRESGSIEQDADQVLFLYRDDYYKNNQAPGSPPPEAGTSEVIVAKNRHGELDTVKLAWSGEFTQFSSLDIHHSDG